MTMARLLALLFCLFAGWPAAAWDLKKANIHPTTGKGSFYLCSVEPLDVRTLLALDHPRIERVTLCAKCSERDPGIVSFHLGTTTAPAKDFSIKSFNASVYIDDKLADALPLTFAVSPDHTSNVFLEAYRTAGDTNLRNTLKLLTALRFAQQSLTFDFSGSKLTFNARNVGSAAQKFANSCALKLPVE